MRSAWLRAGVMTMALMGVTCAGQTPQDPQSLRRQAARLLDRGDPVGAAALLSGPPAAGLLYLRGIAAADRGLVGQADSLLRLAALASNPESALAAARRADLALAVGRSEEATALADSVAKALEQRQRNSANDWLALGIAYRVLGVGVPAQFKDALTALDRAVAADSNLIDGYLRLGGLLLEKYNGPDARAAFQQALRHDPGNPRAELGLADVALFDGDREAFRLVDRVVAAAPRLAQAHAMIARLELDSEHSELAVAAANRAIALDSTLLEAWATKAAVFALAGDSVRLADIERSVGEWHRRPAAFYAAIAEAVARQRRYAEAAEFAARGVASDSTNAAALTALGTNQLRLGAIDSGRARLAAAFERDPYHVWNKNTLDLLDQTANYRSVASGRFLFVLPADEADLLLLYLGPLLERAYDSLAARYRYRPPTPIRLELYPRHADFSVRTVGLAGLGALGVSFGSVLVMDAPSARPPGDFNWGSTAWHELTHAFTLGMTDHRVPRWLSEGLSVVEERRANVGWGAQATIAFVSALKAGMLRPFSRINDGFVRPRHPADVSFAYYQSSLLCEFLETTFGFESILRWLAAYRDGKETLEGARMATGLTADQLDRQFDEWLRRRFQEPIRVVGTFHDSVAAPGELETLIESAKALQKAGQTDRAIAALEEANRIFPGMAEQASPAWQLAEIYRERGDRAKAVEYYARVTRLSENHLAANRLEATLRAQLNDSAGALAAWERAIYIHPYDLEIHARAAEAAEATGDHPRAIRERLAILALKPPDHAGALYRLAIAYRNAGNRDAARREVIRALEEAPSFELALELLLELKRGGS